LTGITFTKRRLKLRLFRRYLICLNNILIKTGDNFDKKYCDAPDKIGEETQERYEKFLREEATKQIFKDFLYFSQEEEKQDTTQSKNNYNNPHYQSNSTSTPQTNLPKVKVLEKSGLNVISIEQKMNRFKKQTSSASASSLLKQYRLNSNVNSNLSNNSTGSTLNMLKKGGNSSSTANFNI